MSCGLLGTGRVLPGWGLAGTVVSHCVTCQSTAFGTASVILDGSALPQCQWVLRVCPGN